MAYRVDNIPLWLKPFFLLYSGVVAVLVYTLFLMVRITCRVQYSGKEHLESVPNAIYAIWHENLFPYFLTNLRYKQPYAWMNHPLWFMKPVHLILRFMGMKKLFLGSTGHGGRDALEKVIAHLNMGYSTLIACDGPAGPFHDLKYGVLEMSKFSGVPIVPVSYSLTKSFRLGGWDKKLFPFPFCTITIRYSDPIIVTDIADSATREYVIEGMNNPR